MCFFFLGFCILHWLALLQHKTVKKTVCGIFGLCLHSRYSLVNKLVGRYYRIGVWEHSGVFVQEHQGNPNVSHGHMLARFKGHWWICLPGWGQKATEWLVRSEHVTDPNADLFDLKWYVADAEEPTKLFHVYMGAAWLQNHANAQKDHYEVALNLALTGQEEAEKKLEAFYDEQAQKTSADLAARSNASERIAAANARKAAAKEAITAGGKRRRLVPEPPTGPPPADAQQGGDEQGGDGQGGDEEEEAFDADAHLQGGDEQGGDEWSWKPKGGSFNHKVALIAAVRSGNWDELYRLCDVFERRPDVSDYVASSVRRCDRYGWDSRYWYQ